MLRRGQKFTMHGRRFTVAYVNGSRAHCIAREPVTVKMGDRTFTAHKRTAIDISPNTCLSMVEEVCR